MHLPNVDDMSSSVGMSALPYCFMDGCSSDIRHIPAQRALVGVLHLAGDNMIHTTAMTDVGTMQSHDVSTIPTNVSSVTVLIAPACVSLSFLMMRLGCNKSFHLGLRGGSH